MKLSFKAKITMWSAIVTTAIVVLALMTVFSVSSSQLNAVIKNELVSTVERSAQYIELSDDYDDDTVKFSGGYIEIDDDFDFEPDDARLAVYDSNGKLLAGSDVNSILEKSLGFPVALGQSEPTLQKADNVSYIVYDVYPIFNNKKVILRGIVSAGQNAVRMSSAFSTSIWLLPMLLLVSVLGGYIIARRSLRPIKEITKTTSEIVSCDDLEKRISINSGDVEIQSLADTFNSMLSRLNKSFELQKQFISDASHELRTPMAVIMAQCEYSLDEPQTDEEYRQALGTIEKQGARMSALIDDILEMSRIENNSERYTRERFDLSVLVKSICEDLALIKEKGITLDCSAEDGIFINGNMSLMSRLLVNLVTNAYRYGRENGKTHVKLFREGQSAVLAVEDNGIGVSKSDLSKIFNRFYQSDTARSAKGNGLGLSMVEDIAKWHGGEVFAQSELGKGSKFIVKIPLF